MLSLSVSGGAAKRTEAHFAIDNYTSYVIAEPLSVKSVRYTDAYGNVTGLNEIGAETNKIDITFSGEIDDTVLEGLSLTAGGKPVEFDEPEIYDNVVTLSIPNLLPGGEDIALAIPAADRVYNVKTKAGKFQISNLALTVNGIEVTGDGTTGAEGDIVVITADVINTASIGKVVTVIYALYNDNELVDINSADVIIDNEEHIVSITTDPLTTKANVSYDTVKAFIWDSFANAKSLAAAVSYPAE